MKEAADRASVRRTWTKRGRYGVWERLFSDDVQDRWNRYDYCTHLLGDLFTLLFDEEMNVFDLRDFAREHGLPARITGQLIAAVYERVSCDIDSLLADHPTATIAAVKVWGLDGRVGYELIKH